MAKDVYNARDERKGAGYRPELSDDETAVYTPEGRKPIVAFRGSVNRGDAVTDGMLALGRLRNSNRWKRTQARVAKIRETVPVFDVAGHSLGGTLAGAVHDDDQRPGRLVAFNPGATLLGQIAGKDGRVYTVDGDAVSALANVTHRDVRVLPANGDLLTSHTVSNFAPA